MHANNRLRWANNVLLAAIVVINLYVIIAPFAPAVVFWWQKNHTHRITQLTQLVDPSTSKSPTSKPPAVPSQDTLVVPAMALQTPILQGPVRDAYKLLDKGVWLWPLGSTPDKGGNTVIAGHRFTYTNPRGIFYELNQVQLGDTIGIFWSGKEYQYQVSGISVVSPNDSSLLNPTVQPELTLYTCTPTWNPTHRLVVTAKLIGTKG